VGGGARGRPAGRPAGRPTVRGLRQSGNCGGLCPRGPVSPGACVPGGLCPRGPSARPRPPRRPQARAARARGRAPLLSATTATLVRLHYGELVHYSAWVLVETGVRLLAPVALREFLKWLERDAAARRAGGGGGGPAHWEGWMWAVAIASGGVAMTIIHHVFFWWGGARGGGSLSQME
jgi:hypothetical protein